MRFLLRTLSLSYVRRHRAKTALTLLGVVVGVATFTAIRTARTTLTAGLRSTVDRMAGKAQLQITSDAGVPEEMQERLRDLAGVKAQSPVIEQVVVAERKEIGSLLVMGVDLLGDREMRDYGFEGEDPDLDDPLLFLAQADSVAISRALADRAGLEQGDRLTFKAPEGMKTVVVRGLLEMKGFAEAFGGNLVVMDVYAAQTLFGRGRRFDRIELRLEPGVALEEAVATVRSAVGEGYAIESPDRRGAQMERLISSFVAGFTISSVFALGIGIFLIFNAFSVAVNRRRRDIGTLRSLGATPREVQALFLVEAAVIGAVGGVLGLLVGGVLSRATIRIMGDVVHTIYGLADASTPRLDLVSLVVSVALGMGASVVGAWGPAKMASQVKPTEALAKGSFSVNVRPPSPLRVLAGALLLGLAVALGVVVASPTIPLFFVIFGAGLVAAVLLTGPLARVLLALATRPVAWLSPVAGRLAVDALRSNPRRASGTVVAMTISLGFVVGMGAYMGSAKKTLSRWMDDILTSDIYVRASANFTRPDFRYPPELRDELLAVPGVARVESYRAVRVPYRGDEILLLTIEIEPMLERTHHDFLEGDREAMRRGLVHEQKCAISDNLYRRFHLRVGDTLDLSTPAGLVKIPIAAVVKEYSSDKGAVFLDRAYFLSLWHDPRVDTFDVSVAKGANVLGVRDAIRARLAGRVPALLSTRAEFKAEIGKAIDAFYALTRVTLLLSLVVAFLGIVTSLLISVAERTREIGILKALGALAPQIRRSVVFEALVVAFTALAIAIPLGMLDARFMETTVAEAFSGWRMPHEPAWGVVLDLLVALPVVCAIAAWLPARSAAATKVTEAIEYE